MNPVYIKLKMLRKFELVKLCKENKIRRYSKLRKMELVDLIFKTLHPDQNKVLKKELPKPEIILKNEPILEIKPLEKVEIIVDIFEEKKEENKEEEERKRKKFNEEYEKKVSAVLEKKKDNEHSSSRGGFTTEDFAQGLDLKDKDVIDTINNLIIKLYNKI